MTGIRYGKIESVQIDGDMIISVEETIHDFSTTTKLQRYSQNVFGESRKQVTAEALKLIDKLSDEDVLTIAYDCAKKNNGSKFKMVVSWTVKV